ncbi:hypothetical protein TrVE_jg10028 [Triparma verrucosa]|uniref:Sphingomyelin synthase-like domain-containing protein n=1 Tax=Triparma verrucosa TaxID=1606542 RepID=A0A9W7FNM4_9STRA|nr:hypothetical protein TrVE_jg10028 [Triparma verrucosa]
MARKQSPSRSSAAFNVSTSPNRSPVVSQIPPSLSDSNKSVFGGGLNWNYWGKVITFFVVYSAAVIWLFNDIELEVLGEKKTGYIPRFILTISYALFPTLLAMHNIQTRRTAAAFLYMQCATVLMNFVTSIAWYRNPRELGLLPDVGHDIAGEFPQHLHFELFGRDITVESSSISDNIILTLAVVTGAYFFRKPNSSDIFRRFIFIYGTLENMRTCVVCLTSLPDASAVCRSLTPIGDLKSGASSWGVINDNYWYDIWMHTLMILIPVHPVTCGDMIFSGHSNTALCLALIWHTYYKWVPAKVNVVKTMVWIATMTACALLIVTKVHYTLDVVLAFYFTVTIWSAYHRLATEVNLGHRFISVWWIDAIVIYPLMEFLELPLEGEHVQAPVRKPRDEMDLFELQIMGMHLDDEEARAERDQRRIRRRKGKGGEDEKKNE